MHVLSRLRDSGNFHYPSISLSIILIATYADFDVASIARS